MSENEKIITGCTACGRIAAVTFGRDEVMRGLPCGECSGDLLPANAEWVSAKFDRLSNQLAEKDAEIAVLKSKIKASTDYSREVFDLRADNHTLKAECEKLAKSNIAIREENQLLRVKLNGAYAALARHDIDSGVATVELIEQALAATNKEQSK